MLLMTTIMYLAATAHFLLSLYAVYISIFNEDGAKGDGLNTTVNNFRDPVSYSQIAIEIFNVSTSQVKHVLSY